MFWVVLLLFIGTTVLNELLKPRTTAKASGLGDFQAPTADASRMIPVIFGTVKLTAPNVVWYGDLKTVAIKKGGVFGIPIRQSTVGYKYWLGMQLSLCHGPIDEFIALHAGTAPDDMRVFPITVTPDADKVHLSIDAEKLFGGEEDAGAEGGLKGIVILYKGTMGQPVNLYLKDHIDNYFPTYAGLCYAALEQVYLGMNSYLKNWSFEVRRTPDALVLGGGRENILGDANPANIIYETMINKIWGLGRPAGTINKQSFIVAGNTLATELFGLSMQIDSETQADTFLTDVLKHIDAVLYTDPQTGLWTLKLIRADYILNELPEFGPADVLGEPDFSRPSWTELLNQVFVEYIDRLQNYKPVPVKQDELANWTTQGDIIGTTFTLHGISNNTLAQKIAARELKVASYPLGQLHIKLNRKAWQLRVGSPFKFSWPLFGIEGMVCRVGEINYGALEKGEIEVSAVEDIFGIQYTGYNNDPNGSNPDNPIDPWVDPITPPDPVVFQIPIEVPYQMQDGVVAPRLMVGAIRGKQCMLGYEIWVTSGEGYTEEGASSVWCSMGYLTNALSKIDPGDGGISVSVGYDLDKLGGLDTEEQLYRGDNLLMFEDGEICGWKTVTDNQDGTYTIGKLVRAVYDTFPTAHPINAKVWFIRVKGLDLIADIHGNLLSDSGDDSIVLNDGIPDPQ